MVEDPKRPGKLKKVKKQIPAYIPEQDAEILAAVRRRAYRLDMCLFNLFGIRFGWEAVIGFVPAVGDAIGALMALMLFRKICTVEGGIDQSAKMWMILNILVDFAVGLIPFIGDLADAAFKCNTKNLRLLECHLDKKYKPSGRDERDLVGVDREKRRKNRASGIFDARDPPPATAFDDSPDEDEARQVPSERNDGNGRGPREPERVRTNNGTGSRNDRSGPFNSRSGQ